MRGLEHVVVRESVIRAPDSVSLEVFGKNCFRDFAVQRVTRPVNLFFGPCSPLQLYAG